MKASELRIGNWVQLGETTVQVDIITIYEPDNKLVSKSEPIPLTEEWLLEFKAKQFGSAFKLQKGVKGITIRRHPNGFFLSWPNRFTKLEYVHQLQNLYFALTGEELTLSE